MQRARRDGVEHPGVCAKGPPRCRPQSPKRDAPCFKKVASLRAPGGPLGGPLVILAIFSNCYGHLKCYLKTFIQKDEENMRTLFRRKAK